MSTQGGAFAQHAKVDAALAANNEGETTKSKGLTTVGKVVVFFLFPVAAGFLGLYFSYVKNLRDTEKEVNFDEDFLMPFLLALAMSIVVGFQTQGYSSSKVKPLVAWPKARRVKKIVRKKKGEIELDRTDFSSESKKDD